MEFDTIAAISTALGEGSVAMIRVSGEQAIACVDLIWRGSIPIAEMGTHTLQVGKIYERETGEILDEVVLLLMKGPRSYTREDVVEIHCHGGVVAVNRVLAALLRSGVRLADPGEFTKRAFLNGRIDLAQAEGIIDVIRAKTDQAQRMAMGQVSGQVSKLIRSLRHKLIELLAHIEVTIDYPEHDVEDVTVRHLVTEGSQVVQDMQKIIERSKQGRVIREGLRTAIVGRPNVGKSSLLNALSQSNRAIVTDIPGTTRDIVEELISIRGIPLVILDTAGIRETEDVVEKIGVHRSREALSEADLVLVVLDATVELTDTDRVVIEESSHRPRIVVLNKVDLPAKLNRVDVAELVSPSPVVSLSAREETGLEELEQTVYDLFIGGKLEDKDASYVSNVRHIHLLEQALASVTEGIQSASEGVTLDLVSVDFRNAWELLGEIIGETMGEDLLDQIFSQFCLGK